MNSIMMRISTIFPKRIFRHLLIVVIIMMNHCKQYVTSYAFQLSRHVTNKKHRPIKKNSWNISSGLKCELSHLVARSFLAQNTPTKLEIASMSEIDASITSESLTTIQNHDTYDKENTTTILSSNLNSSLYQPKQEQEQQPDFIHHHHPTTDSHSKLKSAIDGIRTQQIPIAIIPNALSQDHISRLLQDAQILESVGFGVQNAGIGSNTATTITNASSNQQQQQQQIRKNVHQSWLASIGDSIMSSSDVTYFGNLDARHDLFRFVERMRLLLVVGTDVEDDVLDNVGSSFFFHTEASMDATTSLLDGVTTLDPRMIELSYLSYAPGSYYKRHVDRISRTNNTKTDTTDNKKQRPSIRSNRVISFILYLGSSDDECKPWCIETDGGALRVFGNEAFDSLIHQRSRNGDFIYNDLMTNDELFVLEQSSQVCGDNASEESIKSGDEVYLDIIPKAGTLVIFNSVRVPHEVRTTLRSRRCVVGWFSSPL